MKWSCSRRILKFSFLICSSEILKQIAARLLHVNDIFSDAGNHSLPEEMAMDHTQNRQATSNIYTLHYILHSLIQTHHTEAKLG